MDGRASRLAEWLHADSGVRKVVVFCDAHDTADLVCEALVAQTGSVLITNRSCGGRALSVLPPHHIVLAHKDQLEAFVAANQSKLSVKPAK